MTITNYTCFLFLCCYHIRIRLVSRNHSSLRKKVIEIFFCCTKNVSSLTFLVVQTNGLRFKFGLFNGICNVSVLVFELLNLIDLSVILFGTKACLADKNHICHRYLKISFQNGLVTEFYYCLYLLHFQF